MTLNTISTNTPNWHIMEATRERVTYQNDGFVFSSHSHRHVHSCYIGITASYSQTSQYHCSLGPMYGSVLILKRYSRTCQFESTKFNFSCASPKLRIFLFKTKLVSVIQWPFDHPCPKQNVFQDHIMLTVLEYLNPSCEIIVVLWYDKRMKTTLIIIYLG